MLQQIKIMLGMSPPEQRDLSRDSYTSFVKDVQSMDNKTRPQLDDHNLIKELVKLARSDDSLRAIHAQTEDCGPEHPASEGFVSKLKRLLGA